MDGLSLKELLPGQRAYIEGLQGSDDMVRRLKDLGFVRGTEVSCVGVSPLGDPKAYQVRGTVIGLRAEDSGKVSIGGVMQEGENQMEGRKHKKRVIALAGNPNVGKSTVFNQLTGLRQHTGNWPGKTVTDARGSCTHDGLEYEIVDIPGCYSLMAHSAEEEVARDFICFGQPDAVIVVCDATCLERNLNLVLQIMEASPHVVLCVNLMDEARKKHIRIDLKSLEEKLGIPVIGTVARSKKGLHEIFSGVDRVLADHHNDTKPVAYPEYIEKAILEITPLIEDCLADSPICLSARWLAVRLLDGTDDICRALEKQTGIRLTEQEELAGALKKVRNGWEQQGISRESCRDDMVTAVVKQAEELCADTVVFEADAYDRKDRKLDWLFTSKATGFPIMFLILLGIFWITITGANYPSQMLNSALMKVEGLLVDICIHAGIPVAVYGPLLFGVYRVLAWVVSVMLPPMAIFFPLFTLLEDFGYLPRVAFNMDKCFQKCHACGKQALTMCMGFGCNAAGVVGCRIIDSPRERLIAMITNNFVPCNGRFPTLIAIITMFFIGSAKGTGSSLLSALFLALVILLGIGMTFFISWVLSRTILKGIPSSFTLELPPYRRPQVMKVIVRSIFDRTLFVLGRAIIVAAPAGLIIWILANVQSGDMTLLARFTGALDPFGRLLGMDGVILAAFILGFPANEIVIPIMVMAYMANGSLSELNNLTEMKMLLTENGWTWITAVSTMLFSLMHWPCSTTCLTLKKETQSMKWTIAAFLVPTICGIILCFLFTAAAGMITGINA